ncbi:hypothetical protein ASC59_05820 [Leifsonia sp. Root1293]|nr:hypothetical protein ASC59_05820 [Leifsonia sp. Root1293]KRA11583.1 hypothetical protein ASD61_05820 [Leifsonia sp. Root60]
MAKGTGMFRRRRHDAPVVASSTPELTPEQVFDLLNSRLADVIGAHGSWTLVRRTDADTDEIFHAMLTHQIASELTQALLAERSALRGEPVPEPAALSWIPAPITEWAERDGVVIAEAPMAELLDTTDTDSTEIVPARHVSAEPARLVA